MDGTAWLGVGVLVGPPLAAAILTFVPSRRRNGCLKPGASVACIGHGNRMSEIERETAVLRESLERSEASTREGLERTEKGLEQTETRICDRLVCIEKTLERLRD